MESRFRGMCGLHATGRRVCMRRVGAVIRECNLRKRRKKYGFDVWLCYSKGAMKKLLPLLAVSALLSGCATVTYQQVVLPEGVKLAQHETLARFDGLSEQPCQHMTAACPNACDHGGTYAVFSIVEYTKYELLSEHGDPRQETFAVRVKLRDGTPAPETAPALQQVISELEPGQVVGLNWMHLYSVTDKGSFPERIVTRLAE